MDYMYHVFLLLGGIGLFLFGINYMSQGLEQALGDDLRIVLEKLTTKPLNAVLLGAGVTALIQSSGATMVMVVGFVAAELMTLKQGMYVMMGAAIGTTITAQIIAFDIEPWAPLILFVGVVLHFFIKKRIVKKIGAIVLGFGTLFMGIYLMGEAIERMNLGVVMQGFMNNFTYPILALLFGFAFTFVIQSSSASVGILQVLLASTPATNFDLNSVIYIIMGMNVGAIAPVVIAGLAGNKASKRATLAASILKVLSVIVFVIILLVVPAIVPAIAKLSANDVSRQIANFHLIYNIITTILLFPLLMPLSKFIEKLVPNDSTEELTARKLLYLGRGQDKTPAIRIAQSMKEIKRFSQLVETNYDNAITAFFNEDVNLAEGVREIEKTINFLNREIYNYLISLHGEQLPQKDVERLGRMFHILIDLERIGDHADNIAEYAIIAKENRASVSKAAWIELQEMGWKTVDIVKEAIDAYFTFNKVGVGSVEAHEEEIDKMKITLENHHLERMRNQTCDPHGAMIFLDAITDFERVADHATNIAETVLGVDAPIKI